MKIHYTNLGRIKDAQFDVKNLTVIVGDNSMGKTILLESLALFENVMKNQMEDFIDFKYIEDIKVLKINSVSEKDNKFRKHKDILAKSLDIECIKKDEIELINKMKKYESKYKKLLKENILDQPSSKVSFSVEYNKIPENFFPKHLKLYIDISENKIIQTEFKVNGVTVVSRLPRISLNFDDNSYPSEANPDFFDDIISTTFPRIISILNRRFFRVYCNIEETIFFPSERASYQINAKNKSAAFIEETFSKANNKKEEDIRYSESLFIKSYFEYQDYLEFMSDADNIFDSNRDLFRELCFSIGGKPIYEDGMISKIELNSKEEIPKKLFSTKQNRLLPYFMLCTPIMLQTNRVIIEEPEAHMSLKSMFELQKIIGILLRNTNVIITSHSDVFVTLLNNLIIKNNIGASIYELVHEKEGHILKKLDLGPTGAEFSFMSDQLLELNKQIMSILSEEGV